MATIRTHRFFNGPIAAGGALTTLYTVGSGQRALIKYAAICNQTSAARGVQLIVEDGAGVFGVLLQAAALAVNTVLDVRECYAVVEAGGKIVGFASALTGGAVYFHVGGVLFDI